MRLTGDEGLARRYAIYWDRLRGLTWAAMAWFLDPENPTGHRYAWQPHHNDPAKLTVWRFPDQEGDGCALKVEP